MGANPGSREPNPQAVSALTGFDPGREEYVVEAGIPVPPKAKTTGGNAWGRRPRYPWGVMAPGDSFLIPKCSPEQWNAVNSAAAHQRRITGARFTMRKQGCGLRIWRVL